MVLFTVRLQPAVALELPELLENGGRFIATLHHRNHLPAVARYVGSSAATTIRPRLERYLACGGGALALRQFGSADAENLCL